MAVHEMIVVTIKFQNGFPIIYAITRDVLAFRVVAR